MNNTSLELFKAVSQESWSTPIIKPTPTTCIAISLLIPKDAHATGMSNNEPPATPEAPQAPTVAIMDNNNAIKISTSIPSVRAAARERIAIVIAAPDILIVAPSGIEIE